MFVVLLAALAFAPFTAIELLEYRNNMEENKTFACAINCMDGRVQDAVKNYIIANYHVNYVDMITEAGADKLLADNSNIPIMENVMKRVEISFHHHGSKILAIACHFGCAGNPVSKEEHVVHLRQAKKNMEAAGFNGTVVLLWVAEDFKTVEKID